MTEQRPKFTLIPWQEDFLPALLRLALQEAGGGNLSDGGGNLDDALFVFPHARPARYLERLIRLTPAIAKPCLLPEMLPVHSLFEKIRAERFSPAISLGLLDQVGLLLECARAEYNGQGAGIFPFSDARVFFPWGIRLANLFEDCFIHGVRPGNFPYLEGELAEYAVALLEHLGSLYDRYVNALTERNRTTSGFTALQATNAFLQHSGQSRLTAGKRIYLAGFHSLNGCEDKIFHQLWADGARVVLHGDPALADPGTYPAAHWSCAELEKWRSRWHTGWQIYSGTAGDSATKPRLHYYSGYDLHSQLAVLQTVVASEAATGNENFIFDKSGDLAIILPEADLLLPTLHHLRDYDLNISLGYPLDQAPLNRLLENLLTLQENRREDGYYWKDLLTLFRHPYVKMLAGYASADQAAENQSAGRNNILGIAAPDHAETEDPTIQAGKDNAALWRDFLHRLELRLRQGRRFTNADALLRETVLSFEDAAEQKIVANLAGKMQTAMLDNWSCGLDPDGNNANINGLSRLDRNNNNQGNQSEQNRQGSLDGLATTLEGLCALLLEQGEALWPRFPIDAECLYRLMQKVLPQLRLCAMSREKLPQETLFVILRQLIAQERVPFDAYPLTAMQILGLLESRLLHFRKVCILEATDNALPGGASNDPLLPDSLRLELGLPDTFRKQQMSAYYFFRLLHGAEEVHLFWQEGSEPQGLQDAKKARSRFVEELLWQEEQALGRRLKPERKQAAESTARVSGALKTRRGESDTTSVPGSDVSDLTGQSGKPEKQHLSSNFLSDGPLRQLASAPGPIQVVDREIKSGAALTELLARRLQNRDKPVSASLLNSFITCPQAFYCSELIGLRPLGEVAEDEDPGETGQLLHKVFAEHYSGKLNQELHKETQSRTELVNTFHRVLESSAIPAAFPQDALAGLRAISPLRLGDYLGNQPEVTRVLALEVTAEAMLDLPSGRFFLAGRMDRLDERKLKVQDDEKNPDDQDDPRGPDDQDDAGNELIILDYKTGKPTPPVPGFWSDAALWADLERAVQTPEKLTEAEKDALLDRLSAGLNNNLQLPFYLYLLRFGKIRGDDRQPDQISDSNHSQPDNFSADKHKELSDAAMTGKSQPDNFSTRNLNAAWVELSFQGKELPLFSAEYSTNERAEIIECKIPVLLGFVLTRLLESVGFKPRRGKHCKYCSYAELCTVSN